MSLEPITLTFDLDTMTVSDLKAAVICLRDILQDFDSEIIRREQLRQRDADCRKLLREERAITGLGPEQADPNCDICQGGDIAPTFGDWKCDFCGAIFLSDDPIYGLTDVEIERGREEHDKRAAEAEARSGFAHRRNRFVYRK